MNIKEFSRCIGVSTTTISHALNGKRPVKRETRDLILTEMVRLGYTPNVNARRLVSAKSNLIGIFFQELDADLDPYQMEIVRTLCKHLRASNYDMLLDVSPRGDATERFEGLRRRVLSHAIDGSVVIGSALTEESFVTLATADCPCVYIDTADHGPIPHVTSIGVNCFQAFREAIRCLLQSGHRRIALLGRVPEEPVFQFWTEELQRQGLAPTEELIAFADDSPEAGYNAALKLLLNENPPDAILARTDTMGFGALKAAKHLNRHVPRQLALVGHGDSLYSRIPQPEMATVSYDYAKLGKMATEALFQMMEQPHIIQQPIRFHGTFLPRETVG